MVVTVRLKNKHNFVNALKKSISCISYFFKGYKQLITIIYAFKISWVESNLLYLNQNKIFQELSFMFYISEDINEISFFMIDIKTKKTIDLLI